MQPTAAAGCAAGWGLSGPRWVPVRRRPAEAHVNGTGIRKGTWANVGRAARPSLRRVGAVSTGSGAGSSWASSRPRQLRRHLPRSQPIQCGSADGFVSELDRPKCTLVSDRGEDGAPAPPAAAARAGGAGALTERRRFSPQAARARTRRQRRRSRGDLPSDGRSATPVRRRQMRDRCTGAGIP
jgi:hypothetical protein